MAGENEKKLRTIASRQFTRCCNRLNEAIVNKEEKHIISTKYENLKSLWDDLQSNHDAYIIAIYPDDEDDGVIMIMMIMIMMVMMANLHFHASVCKSCGTVCLWAS